MEYLKTFQFKRDRRMAEESTALDRLHHLKTSCLPFVYGLLKRPQVIQLCDWSSIIWRLISRLKGNLHASTIWVWPFQLELNYLRSCKSQINKLNSKTGLNRVQPNVLTEIFSENTFVNTHNKPENFQPLTTYYMSLRELIKNCRIQYILNVYSY